MAMRVLLLEDDPDIRDVLRAVIEDIDADIDVRTCTSVDEMVRCAAATTPALVLTDFWGTSQHELSDDERAQIVRLAEAVPTIMVTGRAWAGRHTADELGLVALIPKPFDVEDLGGLVRIWAARVAKDSAAIKARYRAIRAQLDDALAQADAAKAGLQHAAARVDASLLTSREREVTALVAEGLTNAEIAERLVIAPGTVGNHIAHIAKRLGLKNRVQVAV